MILPYLIACVDTYDHHINEAKWYNNSVQKQNVLDHLDRELEILLCNMNKIMHKDWA
jgi:hypothetical protein